MESPVTIFFVTQNIRVLFRFPQNYVLKEKWRKLIAINRDDEFYKPGKYSVVCSSHFSESDMYYTEKGRRRLKNNAIPQLQIYNTSIPTKAELTDGDNESTTLDVKNLCYVTIEENMDNELGSSSISMGSILDSPKTSHLKNELKKCHKRIAVKNKQIRNLQRQIKRLGRRNLTLKGLLKELKNKQSIDEPKCS